MSLTTKQEHVTYYMCIVCDIKMTQTTSISLCLASASSSLPQPLPLPRQNCLEPIPALQ